MRLIDADKMRDNAIPENDFFEICHKVNHGSKPLDFCPNCGAEMRGENK